MALRALSGVTLGRGVWENDVDDDKIVTVCEQLDFFCNFARMHCLKSLVALHLLQMESRPEPL